MLDGKVKPLERHTLRVPGNGITDAGIKALTHLLNRHGVYSLAHNTDGWEWSWRVGGKGEYVGTLPKRVAKWCWQNHQIKLEPSVVSEIGNLGNAHCDKARTVWFDWTQDFDWLHGSRADVFGDGGSCFYDGGCHEAAVPIMVKNGTWAVRFYTDDSFTRGLARAWVVDYPGFCVVLNGYWRNTNTVDNHGTDTTLRIARIVAQWLDNSYYHKLELRNSGASGGTMYINGGVGFAIGPQEVVAAKCSHDLVWDCTQYEDCHECGDAVSERNLVWHNDHAYCRSCYDDLFFSCAWCGDVFRRDDAVHHEEEDHDYCEACYELRFVECCHCEKAVRKDSATKVPDGLCCGDCLDEYYVECNNCGKVTHKDDAKDGVEAGLQYCEKCFEDLFQECRHCGELYATPGEKFRIRGRGANYFAAPSCGMVHSREKAFIYTEATLRTIYHDGNLPSGWTKEYIHAESPGTCPHCGLETIEPAADQ